MPAAHRRKFVFIAVLANDRKNAAPMLQNDAGSPMRLTQGAIRIIGRVLYVRSRISLGSGGCWSATSRGRARLASTAPEAPLQKGYFVGQGGMMTP